MGHERVGPSFRINLITGCGSDGPQINKWWYRCTVTGFTLSALRFNNCMGVYWAMNEDRSVDLWFYESVERKAALDALDCAPDVPDVWGQAVDKNKLWTHWNCVWVFQCRRANISAVLWHIEQSIMTMSEDWQIGTFCFGGSHKVTANSQNLQHACTPKQNFQILICPSHRCCFHAFYCLLKFCTSHQSPCAHKYSGVIIGRCLYVCLIVDFDFSLHM